MTKNYTFLLFKRIENHSVKNNKELVHKLSYLKFQNCDRFISFDVLNLFSSIPINIAKNMFEKLVSNLTFEEIKLKISNFNTIMHSQNYVFQFQNKNFEQTR